MSSASLPLLPEVGVVALVPDRWSAQWQPRNQVLSRLTRYFHVCWVNPAPEWREVWKHPRPFHAPEGGAGAPMIHSPDLLLPRIYRPARLGQLTRQARWSGARRRLIAAGARRIVLYLWRPEFEDVLSGLDADLRCYHIDDEYSFDEVDRPIPAQELRVIESVDEVFIHSPALLEKKGGINPHTTFAPNGVDFAAHSRATPEPPELRKIPHPRVGYTGWLKKQLDWELLEALVARHPDWSFVFVGGSRPDVRPRLKRLDAAANVHLLGARSSEALCAFPQHFDVCVMPYRVDGYTKYIYPLKLHEYLAGGRPVVGSRIPSLDAFEALVSVPEGLDAWSEALSDALAPAASSPELVAARRAAAAEHDWERIVERIARRMAEGLATDLPASGDD